MPWPISVEATFKACVCGLCLTGIAVSNSAYGIDVSVLWVFCVVSWRSLHRADHSSREVLPNVVGQCDRKALKVRRPWPTMGCRTIKYVSGILMTNSRGFWILAHYIQLISPLARGPLHPVTNEVRKRKNSLNTNGVLQWWKPFWAQGFNQEKKYFPVKL